MICAELTSLSLRWSYRQSRVSKVSIIVAFSKKVQCGNCVSGLLAERIQVAYNALLLPSFVLSLGGMMCHA